MLLKTMLFHARSNLVYNNFFTIYKFKRIKKFGTHSFDSKLNDLKEFKNKIEVKPNNEHKIKDLEEKRAVFNTALELYN